MLNQQLKSTQGLTVGLLIKCLGYESCYNGDSEGNTGQEVQNEAASLNSVVK